MQFFIDGEDGLTLLPVREATLTFRLEGEAIDRIRHWVEGGPTIDLWPFDRERMIREEFGTDPR